MPSRERRERAKKNNKEKKLQKEKFDDLQREMPSYIKNRTEEEISRIKEELEHQIESIPKYLNIKSGLLSFDEEGKPSVDIDAMGTREDEANRMRKTQKEQNVDFLRKKYPDLWGKRKMAKVIAALEEEKGRLISVRTIQRYFEEFP